MQPFIFQTFFIILWGILIVSGASAQECVDCHKQIIKIYKRRHDGCH
ncbi:MAG: hypothetical protein GW873_05135 [Nitrospirae bacterium]|nr:hypothetical protein [Nitrospirota bacterium]